MITQISMVNVCKFVGNLWQSVNKFVAEIYIRLKLIKNNLFEAN